MQKLSNSVFLDIITRLLILLVIAKVIALAIWWFLPSDGVELQEKKSYRPGYQRVDFKNMLIGTSAIKTQVQGKKNTSGSISITSMLLKGLYGKGSKGFAIVSLKSSAEKTSVVSVGKEFSGYTLKTILTESVIFVKNEVEYTLHMKKSKKTAKSAITSIPVEQTTKQIARNDINDYIQNKKDIWKDIAIEPLKNGNEFKGFKVKRVNMSSEIASLGLRKGDVIVAANNNRLRSLKDVLEIYKNIKTLKTIQLIVLRDEQEKELIYEIN